LSTAPTLRIAPPAFLADQGLGSVLAALPEARLVGGCVRDAVAGRPVADVDLATPLTPDAVMGVLAAAGLRVIPTGLAHGTVTAVVAGRGFEITTLRRDVATDGRHAVVAFTDDWRADAARRDFTINAMSMQPDGAVYDYFDGLVDLSAGRVRFVGDPVLRIAEDRLRALRFFRFYALYGQEPPSEQTEAALAMAAPHVAALSAERVWSELRRILAAPKPGASLTLMARLGILGELCPEGTDLPRLLRLLEAGAPADPVLRLAGLLDGDVSGFAERLKLTGAERERLIALQAPPPDPGVDETTLRRLLAENPPDILIGRSWLAGPDWSDLPARLAAIEPPVFPLEGRDVLRLGIAPGPQVGDLLRQTRAWWLAGGCLADAAACRAQLSRLVGVGADHSL